MRVAFQGVAGAFGEAAALVLWPDCEPVGVPSFQEVVAAVESGRLDGGVLPVENAIVGPVRAALAALEGAARVSRIMEAVLPVELNLLGVPGTQLDELRWIAGQPVALAQCRRFLGGLGRAAVLTWYDSAAAAREAARRGDRRWAAVAGLAAARRYRLDVLKAGIQDQPDNATRFVGIGRRS